MVYALPGQEIDWSQPRLPIPKEMQSFNLDDLCTCPSCGLQRLPETLDQKLSELVPPKVNSKFSSFKSFNDSFKPNSNTIGTGPKATASDTLVASTMPSPGDASKSVKHYKTKAFGAESTPRPSHVGQTSPFYSNWRHVLCTLQKEYVFSIHSDWFRRRVLVAMAATGFALGCRIEGVPFKGDVSIEHLTETACGAEQKAENVDLNPELQKAISELPGDQFEMMNKYLQARGWESSAVSEKDIIKVNTGKKEVNNNKG